MKAMEEVTALTENYSIGNDEKAHPVLGRHVSLEKFHWFSGLLSRDQSEDLLIGFPNGAFLIRENKDRVLVLSVNYSNLIFHIKIKEQLGHFYLSEGQRFSSIEETISYYQDHSLSESFPQLPTVLTELMRNTYI